MNSITPLQECHDNIIALTQAVERENEDRGVLKLSPKYIELEKVKNEAQLEQDSILNKIPDSSKELQLEKEAMMQLFLEEGLTKFRNCHAKMGNKKEVNISRLLNTLGGDVGLFMEISGVSQRALNDFASSNSHMKTELLSCIDVTHVIKDIEIDFAL